MATALDPVTKACRVVNSVRSQAIEQLVQLNQRFEAARRSVSLVRGLAESAIPQFPNLPALVDLDWASYRRVLAACPGLGLPAVPAQALSGLPGFKQLDQLRSLYEGSLRNALNKLERTPMGLIDKLEQELNKKIHQLLKTLGPLDRFLDCACAVADEVSNPNSQDVERAKKIWEELKQKPSVLDTSGQRQLAVWREQKEQLQRVLAPIK